MRVTIVGLFGLGTASFFFTLFMLQVLEVRKVHDPSHESENPKLTTLPVSTDTNSYSTKRFQKTPTYPQHSPVFQYKDELEQGSPDKILSTSFNTSHNINAREMKRVGLPKHFEMKAPQSLQAKYIEHNKRLAGVLKRTEIKRANDNRIFQPTEGKTAWDLEQNSRRRRLRSVCEETSPVHPHWDVKTLSENPHVLNNILVDDKNHLLFCYVPKVACTQWKRVMLNLTGLTTSPLTLHHHLVHSLAFQLSMNRPSFSADDIQKRLTTYKTVLFSRHPLERILSAYRDKFEQNTPDSKVFVELHGKKMLSRLNRNMTYLETSKMMSLTFKDMLEFLGLNPPSANQEHWKPTYHLCHPCTINYTYLGRFDDLFRDSTEILSRVLGPNKVHFPAVRPSTTSKRLLRYLSEVPASVEHQFRKVFRMDYDLFGYH